MNRIGSNTIVNLVARIWSMISVYIFVPIYISILGEPAYGLVSFFATLQTAFNVLGLGLSNTLRREFAVGEREKSNDIRKYKLLRSIELIYLGIACLICAICFFSSDKITTEWLNIESLNPLLVSQVISLMGISIALQLVANLYVGCLFGLNHQVLANVACIVWSASKSVGSLLVIWVLKPSLILFYTWHILCDATYLIYLRIKSVSMLHLEKNDRTWSPKDFLGIKYIIKYAMGILFISFVALINKQLDKVIISKNLTLSELGAYNVATTLGSLTTFIPTALYVSIFPVFTKLATTGEKKQITELFTVINKVVNVILSSMIAFIAIYSSSLIDVWTGSNTYVQILGSAGVFVVLAVGLVEFQEIPYALALANGNTKYNVLVGGAFIPITFISTYYGIKYYGLLGAGVVYMSLMLLQTLFYDYLIYKKFVYDKPVVHIFTEILIPLGVALVIAFLTKCVVDKTNLGSVNTVFVAIILGIITLTIEMFLFARKECTRIIKLKKGDNDL